MTQELINVTIYFCFDRLFNYETPQRWNHCLKKIWALGDHGEQRQLSTLLLTFKQYFILRPVSLRRQAEPPAVYGAEVKLNK